MKTYFVTLWKMNWSLLTEYWWLYLIEFGVLMFLVLKYEKQIVHGIVSILTKLRNLLGDYEDTLKQEN